MLDENLLDGVSKDLDVSAKSGGHIDKVRVDVVGERVGSAEADDRTSPLRDLAENDPEVRDRGLDGLLQLAEVGSGILKA